MISQGCVLCLVWLSKTSISLVYLFMYTNRCVAMYMVIVMDAHMTTISCDLYHLHHMTMVVGLDRTCVDSEVRVRVSYSADMLEHVCYLISFISLTNTINNMHTPLCILTYADSFPHVV